jgi:hypothetical protein
MTLREFHRLGKIAVFCTHRMFRANEKTCGLAIDKHAFSVMAGHSPSKDGLCLAMTVHLRLPVAIPQQRDPPTEWIHTRWYTVAGRGIRDLESLIFM